jgi:predicted RNase H-like nuclease
VKTLIIGIDVATADARIGLSMAAYEQGKAKLLDAALGARGRPAGATVAEWIKGRRARILLALDAPLGWPAAMGKTLAGHRAGEPIAVPPNQLFRRETDRYVQREIGKTPLDVGADRIARTAHAALMLLSEIGRAIGRRIPLAWSPDFPGVAAIEVYPAATLKSLKTTSSGYKSKDQEQERSAIVHVLARMVSVGRFADLLRACPDVLDSLVCVVAGLDFICGRAMAPEGRRLAESEGWIWARRGELPVRARPSLHFT